MASIAESLARQQELRGISDTPGLDVSLLLCHCLNRPRSYLYAYPEAELSSQQQQCFEALLMRRLAGEPVAHLTGRRAFWSLELTVDNSTLIPRPDTECLVEQALRRFGPETDLDVLDLGCGTGAIALALACERPGWRITGVDRSAAAVILAQRNASEHGLERVCFLQSDWFSALGGARYHLIVGNPPYIAEDDPHLAEGDVRFEPRSALVAGSGGLADIAVIAAAAPRYLRPGGLLMLEHGYQQGAEVRALFEGAGLVAVQTLRDYGDRERVTLGSWSQ